MRRISLFLATIAMLTTTLTWHVTSIAGAEPTQSCVYFGIGEKPPISILRPMSGAYTDSQSSTDSLVLLLPDGVTPSTSIEVRYTLAQPASGPASGTITVPAPLVHANLCPQPGSPMPDGAQVSIPIPKSPNTGTGVDTYVARVLVGGTEIAAPTTVTKSGPHTAPTLSQGAGVRVGEGMLEVLGTAFAQQTEAARGDDVDNPQGAAWFLGNSLNDAVEGFVGGTINDPDQPNRAYVGVRLSADRFYGCRKDDHRCGNAYLVNVFLVIEVYRDSAGKLAMQLPEVDWTHEVNRCGIRNDPRLGVGNPYALCAMIDHSDGLSTDRAQRLFGDDMGPQVHDQFATVLQNVTLASLVPGLTGKATFTGPVESISTDVHGDSGNRGFIITTAANTNVIGALATCNQNANMWSDEFQRFITPLVECGLAQPITNTMEFRGAPLPATGTALPLALLKSNTTPIGKPFALSLGVRPDAINQVLGTLATNGALDMNVDGMKLSQRFAPYVDSLKNQSSIGIRVPAMEIQLGSVHALIDARLFATLTNTNGFVRLSRFTILASSIKVTGLNPATAANQTQIEAALQALARILDTNLCGVIVPSEVGLCAFVPAPLMDLPFTFSGASFNAGVLRSKTESGSLGLWVKLYQP